MQITSINSKRSLNNYFSMIIKSKSKNNIHNKLNKIVEILTEDTNIKGKIDTLKFDKIRKIPIKSILGVHDQHINNNVTSKIISIIPGCINLPIKKRTKNVFPWLGIMTNKQINYQRQSENTISEITKMVSIQKGGKKIELHQNDLIKNTEVNNSIMKVTNENESNEKKIMVERIVTIMKSSGWKYIHLEIRANYCEIKFNKANLDISLFIFSNLLESPPHCLLNKSIIYSDPENLIVGVIYEGICTKTWKNHSWDLIKLSEFQSI